MNRQQAPATESGTKGTAHATAREAGVENRNRNVPVSVRSSPVLRATPGSVGLLAARLVHLQRSVGNQTVARIIAAQARPAGVSDAVQHGSAIGGLRDRDRPQPATTAAQERLHSLATSARAVLAEAPTAGLPEAKSPGARNLLNVLNAAGRQGRNQIAAAATSAIASTQAAADRHATEVQVAEAASTGEVQAHFQTAHQQLSATIEQQAGSISQKHDAERNSLADWHAQARGRAAEAVQYRSDALASAGAAQAARITGSGERAAETARGGLSSAASQAQAQPGGGGGGAGEGHGEVAKRLGGDAAAQFEAASGEVGTRLQTHAGEAAAALDAHTGQAATAIAGHAATLGGQIDQT